MKFGILQIVVILVLVIFLLVAVVKPTQKFTRSKFGNIYKSDVSGGFFGDAASAAINTVTFSIAFNTPSSYTINSSSDNLQGGSLSFNKIPLLWLVDISNPSSTTATSLTSIASGPFKDKYIKPKASELMNTDTTNPVLSETAVDVSGTSPTVSKNLINISNLYSLGATDSNVSVLNTATNQALTGVVTLITSTNYKITINSASNNNIVGKQLVIGRKYALGISLMNSLALSGATWHGSASQPIINKYSQFTWLDFTITQAMVSYSGISDAQGIPLAAASVVLSYTNLVSGNA